MSMSIFEVLMFVWKLNFNLMLFTLGPFCFTISLLTAYIIVYIPYWSYVKSR